MKIIAAIIIALLALSCTHKDKKSPDRPPYKSHNKFHK